MKDVNCLSCFEDIGILENLKNKAVFVTGATGLIGQTVVKTLLYANNKSDLNIKIYAFVRSREKAEKIFQRDSLNGNLIYIEGDILEKEIEITESIDYIIHGASVTDSMEFIKKPVETINTGIIGTENILNFAIKKRVESVVYLSSMEVYGKITKKIRLRESDTGYMDPLSVRSSYSESKRMAENICVSFFYEYDVPVKIIRLAQTFGPGVKYIDNRVFAEFARCAIERKDIVLHTPGRSERMYLYSYDAASAILTVLIKGINGQAYNAANESTYCSIRKMAELVKKEIANDLIHVTIQDEREKAVQYTPEHYLYLDTEKLMRLGWSAKTDLVSAYRKMIESWKR